MSVELNYYPFIVDYDFMRLRPRGGSARIDFFSSGRLFSIVNEMGKSNIIYIQKEDIAPESGFFLVDFAEAKKDPKKMIDTLKGMNMSDFYIENSKKFPLDSFFKETDLNIRLVDFLE